MLFWDPVVSSQKSEDKKSPEYNDFLLGIEIAIGIEIDFFIYILSIPIPIPIPDFDCSNFDS